ncbi:hypothetical protein EYF80_035057 [Liparis tanakae]|uniref:Uncharacterized protein n=1 Tax=Liparis tanakae TaxID=230148 RepID=A0A4Z2GPK7_9TELE|nr:hypothetical protein EYF80_035057 [Liparis tanakae]
MVVGSGETAGGRPSVAVQAGQQVDGGRQGPGVRVTGLLLLLRRRRGDGTWFWKRRRLGWGGRGRGAPELLSEAGPGGAGVGEVGGDDPVALGAADHVADLPVELQQLGADEAEVLAGAHQGDGARLAQRLVAEVDVEQRVDLALRAAAEHAAGPQPPANERRKKALQYGLHGRLRGGEAGHDHGRHQGGVRSSVGQVFVLQVAGYRRLGRLQAGLQIGWQVTTLLSPGHLGNVSLQFLSH